MREELRSQVKTHLGQGDGVLVFDPSGFPKSGRESVGVARQWCGRLGKVDNCQVAIYLGYVSRKGHTLVDTRLYLPKEWTKDKARLDKAVLIGGLTLEDTHKGLHEGVEAWHSLLKNLRGNLTFVKQLVFTKGVSRFHGTILL